MKLICPTAIYLAALVLSLNLPGSAFANLIGTEDFSGATVDPTKWGSDFGQGVGLFTQTNGQLQFSTSGTPTANDQAIHPWILNQGSYTQNWSVQLDVNLPHQTITSGQDLSIGLAAVNASNQNDNMTMSFQQDTLNGTLFYSGVDINNVAQTPVEQGGFTPGLASVRLSYDAATHIITGSYDANGPTGGYSWTPFATQDASTWGMSSSDQFLVAITAFSGGDLAVSPSEGIWADNFLASPAIPEPSHWILICVTLAGLMAIRRHFLVVRVCLASFHR